MVWAHFTQEVNVPKSSMFDIQQWKKDQHNWRCEQGRNEGHNYPRAQNHFGAPNHCGGRRKDPTMSQILFSTPHLLLKDLRFEHEGVKLVSCPWRPLTSLRIWVWHHVRNCPGHFVFRFLLSRTTAIWKQILFCLTVKMSGILHSSFCLTACVLY